MQDKTPKEEEKKIKDQINSRIGDDEGDEKEPEEEGLPDRFIDQCFNNNIMGDAVLFSSVCKGRFLYNGNSGNWHRWGKHYWQEDKSNSVLAAIGNEVAEQYEARADNIGADIQRLEAEDKDPKIIEGKQKKKDTINKRAFSLKGDRAKKVLGWVPAIDPDMVIEGDDFDKSHHFLACQNGVINMETMECLPGDPADRITLSTPHEWPGLDDDPETYINYLRSSLAAPHNYPGDKEKFLNDRFEYVHRFLGAATHGAQKERAFMVLFGEHGWNGKGTLMETLLYVLGDYAAPTEPEVLLDSKGFKEAGKPTPQILAMKGRRIIVASETDDGNKFSASAVKRFSGGDTLTGRNPHDIRPTYFKPTHTLFLMTNSLPYTNADDRPFWNRLHILNFHWSFVDNPVKPFEKPRLPNLEEDLRKEAPQIMAWLVKGYNKYLQAGGLNPPEEMLEEREKYRFRDDTIGQFVDACCKSKKDIDPTQETPFKDIREKFDPWYLENISKKPMSAKMLGTLLTKKFDKVKTKSNLPAYIGIQLKESMDYLDE